MKARVKLINDAMPALTVSIHQNSYQDPAVKGTVFAGLAMAEGLTRENTEADYYLAVRTRFVRQRNRLTGQMNVVAENCRKWISGWGK